MFEKVKNVVLLIIAVLGFVFAGPQSRVFRSQQAMSALRTASSNSGRSDSKNTGRLDPNVSGSIIALAVERCLKEAETVAVTELLLPLAI